MSVVDSAKEAAQAALMGIAKRAVAISPDAFIPTHTPDPLISHRNGHVGRPISRLDGPQKVEGKARFAAEIHLDGMLFAAIAYSTIARGRIDSLETADAEASEGVALVMTYANAPRMNRSPMMFSSLKAGFGDDLPIMQDEEIYWNGQPIAVVLAETQEQADHAASLIGASYHPAPAMVDFAQARRKPRTVVTNMLKPARISTGNAEKALAAASYKVDLTYVTPCQNHNAIEPHATTVAWRGEDLLVHDSTQGVHTVAWSLATVFGIDERRVHVTSPFVGGGFGGKIMWQHEVLAAAAAKLACRPVRMALSREGVYRMVGGRACTEQRVALGAEADGRLLALIHTGSSSTARHAAIVEPFTFQSEILYASKNMHLSVQAADLDWVANMTMRAPGEAVGSFGLECAMDELAERLGIDPIELRIVNEPLRDPVEKTPFSARHQIEAWRSGAERFGWSRRDSLPRSRRDGEWLVGLGCAAATYPHIRYPGGAVRITLARDGTFTVDVAAHEMGMGTATVQTQVAADRLQVPLDRIVFRYGDSSLPGFMLAGAAQQTTSIGMCLIAAVRELTSDLLRRAGNSSPLSGLSVDEVETCDGGLCRIGEPECWESYEALIGRANLESISAEGKGPLPLEMHHWSMHSYGAMFCEAQVSTVTGEIRIKRFLGSFDCGRILNPKTAASQFRGGIIMGLGLALMEKTEVDARTGRIVNASLAEYHIPVHADLPDIDVIWTDIPDPHCPMGARGVGEIGVVGVGAAVANAVYNATGKRVRELPITLDAML